MRILIGCALSLIGAFGCNGAEANHPVTDASNVSLDSDADLQTVDASVGDGGPGFPLDGFGEISGDCALLDDEITSPMPAVLQSHLNFQIPYTNQYVRELTAGGQEMIADGNAGGSSVFSEVFAYEVLYRCENAAFVKSETEIVYDTNSKKTDLLVSIAGHKLGVSVTRAVAYPFDETYTLADAQTILEKKLGDILLSTESVSAEDKWQKQILAVLAYSSQHGEAILQVLASVDSETRADTIVWVIVTDGDDEFIYCDGPCA